MTIRAIGKMRHTAKHALVLGGVFAISLATGITAFAQSGTFTLTGSLNTARRDHTATLLQNGEVLVAGGRTLIIILPLHSRAPNCITQLRASGP